MAVPHREAIVVNENQPATPQPADAGTLALHAVLRKVIASVWSDLERLGVALDFPPAADSLDTAAGKALTGQRWFEPIVHIITISLAALRAQDPPRKLKISIVPGVDTVMVEFLDNGKLIPETLWNAWTSFFQPRGDQAGGAIDAKLSRDGTSGNRILLAVPMPRRDGDLHGAKSRYVASVLVVEAAPESRDALCEILRRHGYRVDSIADGYSALLRLRKEKFDVILLDMHLPQLDGKILFRAIANEYPDMALRFIGMSAEESDRTFLDEFGVPFLSKPIQAVALLSSVRHRIVSRARS